MSPNPHTSRDLTKTSPTLLAQLMGLEGTSPLWSESDLAAMMRHLLDSPLPGKSATPHLTFAQILFASHPEIDQLRRVKDFAKSCRMDPENGLPEELATVLYYAAIAAARVCCGQSISQLGPVELRDGIEWALARRYLPDALGDLFRAAARAMPEPRHPR
jgi:hypothetical protein